ncbi:hypothetical protein P153DRAFT_357382 [Dothidotthia symphoricarpi CBS 119687]|uniref:FAD-binding domain-containing protein n=1 Tax=Dothidotthia symphoricarpi CBS 119687 TaxID=1392245 RepID=A0A6A6AAD0_9PLEO|nr:uncharacterized protein P153DRAFT_357382 [Dothidotthia symphoricarpi CBS 119687]KAF2128882.1 hypothetical protein P153DRAFT_357382 [Dothidotthia symphoricarpi CBS 119687]
MRIALDVPDEVQLSTCPIIIIGASIAGLTLAHALKKANISCIVFESDPTELHSSMLRQRAVTVDWALKDFKSCLLPYVFQNLRASKVTPRQEDTYPFFSLPSATGAHFENSQKMLRIQKGRIWMLLTGILNPKTSNNSLDIRWGHKLTGISHVPPEDNTAKPIVIAHFENVNSQLGSLVVGADGTFSSVRDILFNSKDEGRAQPSQYRMLEMITDLPSELAQWVFKKNLYLIQNSQPASGICGSFSTTGLYWRNDESFFNVCIRLSWKHQTFPDFDFSILTGNWPKADIAQQLETFAEHFCKRLGDMIEGVGDNYWKDEVYARKVNLDIWEPRK